MILQYLLSRGTIQSEIRNGKSSIYWWYDYTLYFTRQCTITAWARHTFAMLLNTVSCPRWLHVKNGALQVLYFKHKRICKFCWSNCICIAFSTLQCWPSLVVSTLKLLTIKCIMFVCRRGTPRTKSRQGVGVHPCDVTCPVALDHASLFKRLWCCRVFHGSRPCLSECSDATTRLSAPDLIPSWRRAPVLSCAPYLLTLPPRWEGSSAVTRPTVPYGLRATSLKKSLAGLLM
jgi:hypothetical protein